VDWDDFDYAADGESQADQYEKSARDALETLFDEEKQRVFFANQLAVLNERRFFHWVTSRAIEDLIGEGLIKTETRALSAGGEM
jgi:S-adenosylmethionine:diacylglycerol 3-amino-3-carboxypropyl transferase